MSPLRIYGSTSGYTEIAPNSVASNNTLTLPSTGSSLVSQDANGNITISGILTATSFSGDGSGLTGVGVGASDSINTTGIITASGFVGNLTGTATGLTGTPNIVLGITTVSAGTTSAPSITPTGDSNTGVFFPSADTIALSSGGSERIRVDSSGNINIDSGGVYYDATNNRLAVGTTSPATDIHISGSGNRYFRLQSTTLGTATLGTQSSSYGVIASGDVFLNTTGAPLTFLSDGASGVIKFGTGAAASERARIDSSGRLLVGTSSARDLGQAGVHQLQVEGLNENLSSAALIANVNSSAGPHLTLAKTRGTSNGSNTVVSSGDSLGSIQFNGADGTDIQTTGARISAEVDGTPGSNDMPGRLVFSTTADGASSPTEQMRITQSGVVSLSGDPTGFYDQNPVKFGVNKTSSSGECLVHIRGHSGNGAGANTYALRVSSNADAANANSAALRIDHTNPLGLTGGPLIQAFGNLGNSTPQKLWEVFSYGQQVINRPSSDGTLIEFQQAQTVEGSISVSGSTVSYNGAHLSRWSQLINIDPHDKTQRPEILRGTVMSNLDEMCEWIDPETGEAQDNEQLNKTEISSVEDDPNVAGVFQSWDDDDDIWVNDYYLAMTGDFVIRIAEGVEVNRGDLLISAGDGTAKPQGNRYLKDSTIAKVTSVNVTCTYDDGSYCVPCVLMAC